MKKVLLICFVGVFVLAGCGQKGPLYLPNEATESQQETTSE